MKQIANIKKLHTFSGLQNYTLFNDKLGVQ
jgi:hypothetical protein